MRFGAELIFLLHVFLLKTVCSEPNTCILPNDKIASHDEHEMVRLWCIPPLLKDDRLNRIEMFHRFQMMDSATVQTVPMKKLHLHVPMIWRVPTPVQTIMRFWITSYLVHDYKMVSSSFCSCMFWILGRDMYMPCILGLFISLKASFWIRQTSD